MTSTRHCNAHTFTSSSAACVVSQITCDAQVAVDDASVNSHTPRLPRLPVMRLDVRAGRKTTAPAGPTKHYFRTCIIWFLSSSFLKFASQNASELVRASVAAFLTTLQIAGGTKCAAGKTSQQRATATVGVNASRRYPAKHPRPREAWPVHIQWTKAELSEQSYLNVPMCAYIQYRTHMLG